MLFCVHANVFHVYVLFIQRLNVLNDGQRIEDQTHFEIVFKNGKMHFMFIINCTQLYIYLA